MRSVQIHKTQLLFPSYIFFQRSITHRPWQPPLGRVHYRPVQQRQARMPTCPGSGHSPNIFQQKGEKLERRKEGSWKGGKYCKMWRKLFEEEGKPASLLFCDGDCWPSPFPTHHLVTTPLLATFWKTRRSEEQRRVFQVSCVSRAAPGKPRISASVPPGPPGCKERTVHGWNPAERHNGIPAPCIPPIQWTHCTVVYMLFNTRSAQYRHTILWKYSTRSRQQQSSIEFTALCISPHFRFCWNAWNDFAEHLWEQITAEPLKCCYFDFSKTLGRLHWTVILSRPTLSSVHCLPDVLAPTETSVRRGILASFNKSNFWKAWCRNILNLRRNLLEDNIFFVFQE